MGLFMEWRKSLTSIQGGCGRDFTKEIRVQRKAQWVYSKRKTRLEGKTG